MDQCDCQLKFGDILQRSVRQMCCVDLKKYMQTRVKTCITK